MQPNVLFIFADDQRFDTIGALGNPVIQTPNLDRLAERGVAFTDCCIMGGSSGAVCMPSRAMLHTGRTLFHIHQQGQGIDPGHVLLGEHFRRHGYTTFGTGKWHNGPDSYARSFSDGDSIFFGGMNDHWNVPACRFRADGKYPEPRQCDARWGAKRQRLQQIYDHVHSHRHSTDLFADTTEAFWGRMPDNAPFMAYVSLMAPHDPREMPAEFLNMYDPDQIELPANFMTEHPFDNGELLHRDEFLAAMPRDPDEVRRHIAEYYAMISHLDAAIGRLIEGLQQRGLYDNTIIVFAGDNGLAVGQHALMGKQNLYEHSIRVPLLMAGPGIVQGHRSSAGCYLIDIFPTLCELCSLPTPDTVEGVSLADCLRGDDTQIRDHMLYAYCETMRAVRCGHYKLIEYAVKGTRHTQLFDTSRDPHELHNLADEPAQASRIAQMREMLQRWRTELDDTRPEHGKIFWSTYDGV